MILDPQKIYRLGDTLFIPISEDAVFSIHKLSGKNLITDEIPPTAKEFEGPLDGIDGASTPVRNIISAVRTVCGELSKKGTSVVAPTG